MEKKQVEKHNRGTTTRHISATVVKNFESIFYFSNFLNFKLSKSVISLDTIKIFFNYRLVVFIKVYMYVGTR